MELPRLNKFLASCGVASRRACDELILQGRVEVNGHICTNPATRVRAEDFVKVEGRRIQEKQTTTVAFNKPRGFVCTREDELNRATIYEMIPPNLRHLHHVGRLDLDSEGLLILTNDGSLTQSLMHPSKSVEKEYYVTANQAFESRHLDQFLVGIYTQEGKLTAKAIERMSPRRVKVILEHGAKRQIRVMFDALGYTVTKLLRVRIGSLWLGDLVEGELQTLRAEEIEMLMKNPKPSAKMQTLEAVKDRVEAAKKAAIRERQAREAELEERERRREKRERETRYGRDSRTGGGRDFRGGERREGSERGPRRENRDERGPREFRDERGPRRENRDERGPRRENRDERGPRRENRDERGPRRENRDERGPRDSGGERRGGGGKFSSKKRDGGFGKNPPAPRKTSRPRSTQKSKKSFKRH